MLDSIFQSVLQTTDTGAITAGSYILCCAGALVLGLLLALVYMFKNSYSKQFVSTLALLPAVVQMVIMLVNGNLGTGVAVMGAFSLIRFRSVPGSAKEISSIFIAMAVGLAAGMGYLAIAAVFVVIIGAASMLYTASRFGSTPASEKELRIAIPESLDYTAVFDDLFLQYTSAWELLRVKTTNMGSLYQLDYRIRLKDAAQEKLFLDELRTRNGNLTISCARVTSVKEEL